MLGAFDVFKFQYKQFNTFLNSISSIWYIMNKYTQFTSLGSPIIRIFCDDVLTASCLLYIHSPPPKSVCSEDVNIRCGIMNLISRICEHIKQVDKNQTYIHLRILFESSFIKFLRVFKNLKHKHEFRNVFLFDNNRFILLSLINNPYNQIDENPPDKIQLFDPYVQYLLTIKFERITWIFY